ncbi:MAG TPA: hypothetical protein VF104_08750 [Burkholderiales bacterium]
MTEIKPGGGFPHAAEPYDPQPRKLISDNDPAPASNPVGVREWVSELNPEALMADGFEEAIVGVAERCSKDALVVYDIEKCIEILVKRDGMTPEDAREFFEFNTLGAWAGEGTPLFLTRWGGSNA